MSSELRTDVWSDMVDTDRLARYYGELAGKLARKEQWMTVITTVMAMISLVTALSPAGSWTLLPIALTVASSVLPLIYRVSGVVAAAAYRQQRLGDLLIAWKALWQEIDDLPLDHVREEWQRMARELNEITARMSRRGKDEKLIESTMEQAYDYWENKQIQIREQNEARLAISAV
ncbi:MAG: hypothetical protein OXF01_01330 [Gemmatimonadetes bacterium]|nr:hypothetical protein [Gemmatimonadota bacterium]